MLTQQALYQPEPSPNPGKLIFKQMAVTTQWRSHSTEQAELLSREQVEQKQDGNQWTPASRAGRRDSYPATPPQGRGWMGRCHQLRPLHVPKRLLLLLTGLALHLPSPLQDLQLLPQLTTLPRVGQGPGRRSPTLGITVMTKPRGPLPTPALSYLGPRGRGCCNDSHPSHGMPSGSKTIGISRNFVSSTSCVSLPLFSESPPYTLHFSERVGNRSAHLREFLGLVVFV